MEHNDEIDFAQIFSVLRKQIWMILGIAAVATSVVFVKSFFSPKTYRAESIILTMVSNGKGAGFYGLAAQLGGLMDLGGAAAGGDVSKIMAILESRSLAENVIRNNDLMPVLFPNQWDTDKKKWKNEDPKLQPSIEDGASALVGGHMKFLADQGRPTISVTGIFNDPELAARVVNAYIVELQRYIQTNALTVAKRNRIFIEGQMEQKMRSMLEAGKEISEFYKGSGRAPLYETRFDVPIEVTSPKTSASDGKATAPIASRNLLAELEKMQEKIEEVKMVKGVPQQVYLTYLTRRYMLLNSVYELLMTQHETAKIDESKSDLAFQVVDSAIVPRGPFGPNWKLNTLVTLVASLIVGIFCAFLQDYVSRVKSTKLTVAKLDPLLKTIR